MVKIKRDSMHVPAMALGEQRALFRYRLYNLENPYNDGVGTRMLRKTRTLISD
ncbi:hypothetical protein H0H81_000212 [Sphagnurus paluster]|uniref:Uncharacterized protein n=1 Tax=Sphagnurus paluster TaxID=117069 RepID=A0A9P7GGJ9_9AGAR|nr:hypothetical protein H0H81_000212 [Sphagnurus paluster]